MLVVSIRRLFVAVAFCLIKPIESPIFQSDSSPVKVGSLVRWSKLDQSEPTPSIRCSYISDDYVAYNSKNTPDYIEGLNYFEPVYEADRLIAKFGTPKNYAWETKQVLFKCKSPNQAVRRNVYVLQTRYTVYWDYIFKYYEHVFYQTYYEHQGSYHRVVYNDLDKLDIILKDTEHETIEYVKQCLA